MKTLLVIAASFLVAAPAAAATDPAQQSSGPPAEHCLEGVKSDILQALTKPNAEPAIMRAATDTLTPYICYSAVDAFRAKVLSSYEQSREDKQPGATSNTSGTTSLASKGSSPSLIGFAIEHGGLTQTTDGNTVTFRGNVANSIRALIAGTYLDAYQRWENDSLIEALSSLSFGLSFDTSADQPSTSQGFSPNSNSFTGFSAKYDIYNHRDPRFKEWRGDWNKLANNAGQPLAESIARAFEVFIAAGECKGNEPSYSCWKRDFQADLEARMKKGQTLTDAEVLQLLKDSAERFKETFKPAVAQAQTLARVEAQLSKYADAEAAIIAAIKQTSVFTLEYNFNRPLTTNDPNVVATQPNQKIPSLSNINLVYEKGSSGGLELTVNGGVTFFNSSDPSVPKRGTVRDYRGSLELDIPLHEIQSLGRPTLSFSGQFLALLEEPLGQEVVVNGVTITRKGNIGVVQAKFSLPVKDSGVKIPISISYSNRTDLIKEKDIRGHIGITYDFDSLFAASSK